LRRQDQVKVCIEGHYVGRGTIYGKS
jgi:hypothetical protein